MGLVVGERCFRGYGRRLMVRTVMELAAAVRTGAVSPCELVEETLARIGDRNGVLNAFVAVDPEGARAQAAVLEKRLAADESVGALAGVPIGVKDLEDAQGFVTTCGDPARRGRSAALDDSVQVARLRAAGAIVVGKTNTPAYGFQAETDNLVFGPTHNPWALNRTSGGSSGGSAAAVASGMVGLCTGSDGGGSIRIPSEVCGIAGFKPTHGVVPNGDVDSPTWGPFSTRGPMARTFAEIAYALDVVAGYSPRDLMSFDLGGSFVEAAAHATLEGVRIVWSPTLGIATPDPAIVAVCEQALATLEQHGARVVETVNSIFEEPPVRAWIMRAAAGSLRTATMDPTPWDGRFLPAAQFIARFGESVTTQQLLDAEHGAHRANADLAAVFERADVLVTPGMATVPPRIGEPSPYGPGWASDYTLPFNLVRAPAAVVPCGTIDTEDGESMPVGLQFVMPRCADLRLMSIATAVESTLGGIAIPPSYRH
jgi:aspartyl-tRNA(Asn)/glutamyl-tRNA(Gln) amidotransferase subunit A